MHSEFLCEHGSGAFEEGDGSKKQDNAVHLHGFRQAEIVSGTFEMKISLNLLFLMLTLIYAALLVFALLWLGAHVIGPLPVGDFLESNGKFVQIYTIAALGVSTVVASKFAAKTLVTYLHKSRGLSYEAIESLVGSATLEYSGVKSEP